jgi:hypothetical protein
MKRQVEIYEGMENTELQSLLKKYEDFSESLELVIEDCISRGKNYDDLKKKNSDYAIDISLIRMELNRRLWSDKR